MTRTDKRAANRKAQVLPRLKQASTPTQRISIASDYVRSAMACSPLQAQADLADELVPLMVDAGHRLMEKRLTP
jgi:hypothetical protein